MSDFGLCVPEWFTDKIIKPYHKHTLTSPSEELVTIGGLKLFLSAVNIDFTHERREILSVIGDKWTEDRGDYQGTFPKRFAKWYYQQTGGSKIEPQKLANLGERAKSMVLPPDSTWQFDFTQDFDWDAGDFGDEGSCFWDSREGARLDILPAYGAWAVRYYHTPNDHYAENKSQDGHNNDDDCDYDDSDDDERTGRGYARSWIIPDPDHHDCFLMFNGYGIDLSRQSAILSAFFEKPIRKVVVESENSDYLWINSDMGYAIGNGSRLRYKLFVSIPMECEWCGESFSKNDMQRISDVGWVCESCADNHHKCEVCGDWYENDSVQLKEINGHSYHDWICDDCLSDTTTCPHCDHVITSDRAMIPVDDEEWCVDCSNTLHRCSICDRLSESVVLIDGTYLCDQHYPEGTEQCSYCRVNWSVHLTNGLCNPCIEHHLCSICGSVEDNIYNVDGKHMCWDCRERLGYKECYSCDKYSTDTIIVGRHYYCPSCADREFAICVKCGSKIEHRYALSTPEGKMCQGCIDSSDYGKCRRCYDYVSKDILIPINDDHLVCPKCFQVYAIDDQLHLNECPTCGQMYTDMAILSHRQFCHNHTHRTNAGFALIGEVTCTQ